MPYFRTDAGAHVGQLCDATLPVDFLATWIRDRELMSLEAGVHKLTGAIDCGIAVNPDQVKAQMEGGAVYALTAAFYGQITLDRGRVQQSNFHDYQMLRINEAPDVEVHILDSGEAPGGLGEPGVPTTAPAVCNAIFALTGKRVRSLPIKFDELKRA